MVDEQLPMQRKILKGQVAARNEETSVRVGSEINKCVLLWMLYWLFFFFFLVTQQVKFVCDMTRSNDDKQCGVKVLKMASSDQVYILGFHVTARGGRRRREKTRQSFIH